VVAETRGLAEDGAELVDVTYEPLAPVVDSVTALDPDGPRLFDDLDDNVLATQSISVGDVDAAFAAADRTGSMVLRQHRVAPMPMEGRGAIADFDAKSGELTVHTNCQHPHGLRLALAEVLEIPVANVRVLTPDIGGAFGLKGSFS